MTLITDRPQTLLSHAIAVDALETGVPDCFLSFDHESPRKHYFRQIMRGRFGTLTVSDSALL